MTGLDLELLPTPCFVVDLQRLRENLAVLNQVIQRSGARILLAQKAFSMYSVYPLLRTVLHGVCASSPHEARLGREEFGKPQLRRRHSKPMCGNLALSDHVSIQFFPVAAFPEPLPGSSRRVSYGLRVNRNTPAV